MKVLNSDYIKYSNQPTDITFRNQVGISIKPDETDQISNYVDKLLSEKNAYASKIEQICNQYIFNLGESGRIGGEYIIKQLIKERKQNESSNYWFGNIGTHFAVEFATKTYDESNKFKAE